ncbi:MAG: thioredoxin family protein [Phycisphaerales bacterium]|nr:thioredoxin family protein [Phycisphaerales bacterium]
MRALSLWLLTLIVLVLGGLAPGRLRAEVPESFGSKFSPSRQAPDRPKADDEDPSASPVTVRAVVQRPAVSPGAEFAVAVVLEHRPGWKSWPSEQQDVLPPAVAEFAIRTRIDVLGTSPRPAWLARAPGPSLIQWPQPQPVEVADPTGRSKTITVPAYSGRAVAFVPFVIAPGAPPGRHTLELEVAFQACDKASCLPEETVRLPVEFEVLAAGSPAPAPDAAAVELFRGFDLAVFGRLRAGEERVAFNVFGLKFDVNVAGAVGFAALLLLAALGGLLLNFTPCVLPVIPLKIMGLAASAGDPRRCFALGVVMSLGVVAFWCAIGAAIAFISGFGAISTLFQQPWFTLGVGVFIGIMGLGMFGLFTVRLPQAVYLLNPSHDSYPGSFLFGVMTAVLSTPCTAPFMGSATAWAAKQGSPLVAMVTFASIGLGMALPYLVLSARPGWVRRMPRTGPASDLVKQVMGLLMLAVAAFFLGIGLSAILVSPPDPPSRAYWWAVGAFMAAAGGWMAWRTIRITPSPVKRTIVCGAGALLAVASVVGARSLTAKGPVRWVYYTPERLTRALESGDVVLIDFTAEWCLNCKALEQAVLFQTEVASALNGPGVTPVKVDLTGRNEAGQALLKEMDWVGIPLLAIRGPAASEPIRLGDGYTNALVLEALRKAGWRGPENAVPAAGAPQASPPAGR